MRLSIAYSPIYGQGPVILDEAGKVVIEALPVADGAEIVADADLLERVISAFNGREEVERLIAALNEIRTMAGGGKRDMGEAEDVLENIAYAAQEALASLGAD